jgi:putative endonuclease
MFHVYVLKSRKNGRLYTGQTQDLKRRLQEHNSGKTTSLRSKGPFDLIYTEKYATRIEAVRRELYLKTGKGRDELAKMGL